LDNCGGKEYRKVKMTKLRRVCVVFGEADATIGKTMSMLFQRGAKGAKRWEARGRTLCGKGTRLRGRRRIRRGKNVGRNPSLLGAQKRDREGELGRKESSCTKRTMNFHVFEEQPCARNECAVQCPFSSYSFAEKALDHIKGP